MKGFKGNMPGFGAFNQPWRLSGPQQGGKKIRKRRKKAIPAISPIMAHDLQMQAQLKTKKKTQNSTRPVIAM